MNRYLYFGEKIPEYDFRVLNEREARAAAGILFLFASFSFFQAFYLREFFAIKIFIVLFLVDFFIRVLINPKYAPTLIWARIIVSNQKPEYTGAAQKRFAWSIGLVLSAIMTYVLVINSIFSPFNLLVCLFCLFLLFFETAFGICIGCKMYNTIYKGKAKLCPGGVCEIKKREDITKINGLQSGIFILFSLSLILFLLFN